MLIIGKEKSWYRPSICEGILESSKEWKRDENWQVFWLVILSSLVIFCVHSLVLCVFLVFSWHILMRMKAPKQGSCDPIAPLELPHSLHAFHRVSVSDTLNMVIDFPVFIFVFFFLSEFSIIIFFGFLYIWGSRNIDQIMYICHQLRWSSSK